MWVKSKCCFSCLRFQDTLKVLVWFLTINNNFKLLTGYWSIHYRCKCPVSSRLGPLGLQNQLITRLSQREPLTVCRPLGSVRVCQVNEKTNGASPYQWCFSIVVMHLLRRHEGINSLQRFSLYNKRKQGLSLLQQVCVCVCVAILTHTGGV